MLRNLISDYLAERVGSCYKSEFILDASLLRALCSNIIEDLPCFGSSVLVWVFEYFHLVCYVYILISVLLPKFECYIRSNFV